MEGEEENQKAAANSEMRYIALELMKIALKTKRKFSDVAAEYIENTETLARMIAGEEAVKREAKKESARQR
ncbi:MAG: hypothetical protein N3E51_01160 [Candidatus Micrarchaeota archaeon]|nr:hypothetical protein [Candidatus Micrarchaeota archaeon]